jgi:hypothetical protein
LCLIIRPAANPVRWVFHPWRKRVAFARKAPMQKDMISDGLPNAAERRRIAERARKNLAEAWALSERLDRLERELGMWVPEKASADPRRFTTLLPRNRR